MRSNKRGQAALEFLMTYGWAILVVLVIIGALAYFGVLNPDTLIPEKCSLETGINCQDWQLETDAMHLQLQNGIGKRIDIMNMTASESQGDGYCENITDPTPVGINNGNSQTLTLDCSNIEDTGRKIKLGFEITYQYVGSDLNHTSKGELLANLQE